MIAANPRGPARTFVSDASDDDFGALLSLLLPEGKGLVGVLAAYFDESGTDDESPVMCVAGYLFTAPKATVFTRRWNTALERAGVEYFRMSECAHGRGQFKGMPMERRIELERKLIELIRQYATHGFAVSMSRAEFEAAAPPEWRENLGGAYTACLMMCVMMVTKWADEHRYQGRIAYFFESGHQHASEANRHMENVAKVPSERAITRYASHTFVAKGSLSRPCEAADFLAWHMHKVLCDVLRSEKSGSPLKLELRKDFDALIEGRGSMYYRLNLRGDGLQELFAGQMPRSEPGP
jgi:hypothetical protein